jgi:ABC-type glycerol-3-phosphate transport system substrate-binding protein
LNSQLREFEAAHSNLSILIEQKPVEGPGGIISYLRTGRGVAPSVLPDLIALPTSTLSEPVVQDLVYPLGELIDLEEIAAVYPAPATGIIRDERLFGFPFATSGLTHLAYDPSVVTETVPLTWPRFISDTTHTLVLPADSREGAIFGLQFYLAEGGALVNDAGQPNLEVEPLTQALDQIRLNKANLLQSHQMKTLDEAWQYYQLGLSDFVWTRTDFFLNQRGQSPGGNNAQSTRNQGFLPVPGPTGPLAPLVNSWAWTVSTPDAARQVLATELIQWLVLPDNMAEWSRQSHILPSTREAMGILAEQDPYFLFAGREMERADATPISQSSQVLDVIGEAVFQALTTDTPSGELAETAASALRQ